LRGALGKSELDILGEKKVGEEEGSEYWGDFSMPAITQNGVVMI
jgi:hypothetical protein